jgi:lactam utilization protein B
VCKGLPLPSTASQCQDREGEVVGLTGREVMNEITTVGIDLVKGVFAAHAVARDGRVAPRTQ